MWRRWWCVMTALCVVVAAQTAQADEEDDESLRHESALQIRATPIGLSLYSNSGYRSGLWDHDSPLLDGTYVEGGVTSTLSPAFGWGGPYVELLPVAVLRLRASMQVMSYYGAFGYLYLPDDGQTWDDDALDRAWDDSLGESATGWKIEAQATPQILLGGVVVTAETSVRRIDMDVSDSYYEPFFDLFLEPRDTLFITRPTVGYLFGSEPERTHLVLGARWERAMVRNSGVTRDTVGMVFNWQMPPSVMDTGSPALSGFGGVFVDHPTRGEVAPYFGMQAVMEF